MVHLIGQTTATPHHMFDNINYSPNQPSEAENICEIMGRLCYRSFEPGLNPNVTKIRESGYIENIIRSGHGSVLEHSSANFVFDKVSRVVTHELVRHRVGTAISQESLRYVRLDKLEAYVPVCIKNNGEATQLFVETIRHLEGVQEKLADLYAIQDRPFSEKKELTSAFRRLAPIGLATTIGWTANFRTLRHVIEMRTSPHAEEEIRILFKEVYEICKKTFPAIFFDFTCEDGWCKGEYKC